MKTVTTVEVSREEIQNWVENKTKLKFKHVKLSSKGFIGTLINGKVKK